MVRWFLYRIKFTKDGEDYYYVGKTTNYKNRMQQHLEGQGAKWIKQFPPDVISSAVTTLIAGEIEGERTSSYKETIETLTLMVEHGVRYVRGKDFILKIHYYYYYLFSYFFTLKTYCNLSFLLY